MENIRVDKKKVVYIISKINNSVAFEWISKELSNNDTLDLSFIFLNPDRAQLEAFLNRKKIHVYRIKYSGKKDLVKACIRLLQQLLTVKPHIIHCHLLEASLLGLFIGKLIGIKKRIYTRHHCTYNHLYNKKGVWIDKFINWLATDVIAISKNVENILLKKESVPENKIHLIYHGFDIAAFINPFDSVQLKQKYNAKNKQPVIGVIARWIEWKGIQYIIPAFKQILEEYPNAYLILANAKGPYEVEIKKSLMQLPSESYQIIEFEKNIFALYKLFNVYVHTPIDPEIEAFGQTYVEALAAGVPSVFTLSGIANEFIQHERNALVVPYKSSMAIFHSMRKLIEDQTLAKNLIKNGREDVEQFKLSNMIHKLEDLYENQNSIQNT